MNRSKAQDRHHCRRRLQECFRSMARAGRGDQLVEIRVVTPTKLTAKQKQLLREFAKAGGENPPDENKGFFERMKDALR